MTLGSSIMDSDRLDLGPKSKKNKKNRNAAKSKTDGNGGNDDAHTEDATGEASDNNSEASIPIVCDCNDNAF